MTAPTAEQPAESAARGAGNSTPLRQPSVRRHAVDRPGRHAAEFARQGAAVGASVTGGLGEVGGVEGALHLVLRRRVLLAAPDPGGDPPPEPLRELPACASSAARSRTLTFTTEARY